MDDSDRERHIKPLRSFWRWLLGKAADENPHPPEATPAAPKTTPEQHAAIPVLNPRDFLTNDKSSEFRAFISSYFPSSWEEAKEGHADSELASLKGTERALAERILLAELTGRKNQESAIRGLGILRSRPAVEFLHQRLKTAPDFDTALALWRLESDPHMLTVIAEQIRRLSKYQKISAVVQLREVFRPEVVETLFACLKDTDELVRYNAAQSLLYMHNIPTAAERMQKRLQEARQAGKTYQVVDLSAERATFEVRIMSNTTADRDAAIEELVKALANRQLRVTNIETGNYPGGLASPG